MCLLCAWVSMYLGVRRCIKVCVLLTICAFHLPIVSCLNEADVSQVEDTCDNLQYLSLDVTRDPDYLHGFL